MSCVILGKTFTELRQEYIEALINGVSPFAGIPQADVSAESGYSKIGNAVAYIASLNYEALRQAQLSGFVITAQGFYLDGIGSNYGLLRKPAASSIAYLIFDAPDATIIPIGGRLSTEPQLLNESPPTFEVQLTTTLLTYTAATISFTQTTSIINDSAGGFTYDLGDVIEITGSTSNDGQYKIIAEDANNIEVSFITNLELTDEVAGASVTLKRAIEVASVSTGETQNVGAGLITVIQTTIPGVLGVTNNFPSFGGASAEPDGDIIECEDLATFDENNIDTSNFRGRILFHLFNNVGKITQAGYEKTVLTYPGVVSVFATTDPFCPTNIYIYPIVNTGNGIPSLALLAEMLETLFGDHPEGDMNRGLIDTIFMLQATAVPIDVTADIVKIATTITPDLDDAIRTALEAYIFSIKVGRDILTMNLENVIHDTGLANGMFNFNMTLPVADYIAADNEKAVIGTITLNIT